MEPSRKSYRGRRSGRYRRCRLPGKTVRPPNRACSQSLSSPRRAPSVFRNARVWRFRTRRNNGPSLPADPPDSASPSGPHVAQASKAAEVASGVRHRAPHAVRLTRGQQPHRPRTLRPGIRHQRPRIVRPRLTVSSYFRCSQYLLSPVFVRGLAEIAAARRAELTSAGGFRFRGMPGLPAPPFEFADSAHQIGYPLVQGDSAFPVLLPLDVVLPPAFVLALPFTLLFRYELLVLLYEQFVVCHQLHMARFKPLKSFGHTHVFSVPRAYARVSGEFRSGFRGSGYEADGVEADCVGSISFLTYFGGAAADHGAAIALDSSGGVFFAGSTFSYNFPVVSAFQPHSGGGQDGFVAKLSASGTTIIFSTYYGGSGGTASAPEEVNAIAIGASGNAIVAGTTSSLNLPVAPSPVQATFAGTNTDGFFGRISGTTGALQESRYPGRVFG